MRPSYGPHGVIVTNVFGRVISGVLLLLMTAVTCMAGGTLAFSVGEYHPFMSDSLKHQGIASRIVAEAYRTEGLDISVTTLPWKRAYEEARKGEDYVGSFVWFKNPRRERDFLFSDPVIEERQVLFHIKGKAFDWKNVTDLRQYSLAAISGFSYGEDFDRAAIAKELNLVRMTESSQCLDLLVMNRVDAFPQVLEVCYETIRKVFPPETAALITHHPKVLHTGYSYLMISRNVENGPELLRQFNRGLKELKRSGRFEQIFREYEQGDYILDSN